MSSKIFWSRVLTVALMMAIVATVLPVADPAAVAQEKPTTSIATAATPTPVGTLESVDESMLVDASGYITTSSLNLETWSELIMFEDQPPTHLVDWRLDGQNPYSGERRYVHPWGTDSDYSMEGHTLPLPTGTTELIVVIAVKPENYGANGGINNLKLWLQNPSDPGPVVGYQLATSTFPAADQWSLWQIPVQPDHLAQLMGDSIAIRVVAYQREAIPTIFAVDHWGLYYTGGAPTNTPTPTRTAVATATPTRTPTRTAVATATPTRTPTRTPTKTPCPTLPPYPTATVTPTPNPGAVGQVTFGDTCRHMTSLPIVGMGDRGSCPVRLPVSPQEELARSALMQLPACFPTDPATAAAMRYACGGSFVTEWQVSNGQQIIGKKLTCTGNLRGPDQNPDTIKMVLIPTIELAAVLAVLVPAGVVVLGAVVVGTSIYLVVDYYGDLPAVDWRSVPNQLLADEWALSQMWPPSGIWPSAPLAVVTGPEVTTGPNIGIKIYDGGWGVPRPMWIIWAESRPLASAGVTGLIQVEIDGELRSLLTVISLLPGDNVYAGPVDLRYPYEAANVLARNPLENIHNSTKHPESWDILRAVTNPADATIYARGNPREPNSIEIRAGINTATRTATVAGLWMEGADKGAYFLFSFPVYPHPGQDLIQLGTTPWWYSIDEVVAQNAWYLARVMTRDAKVEWMFLNRDEIYVKWEAIKWGYQLDHVLVRFAW